MPLSGARVQYQVAYQGGEEVPATAFNLPTNATNTTSSRTLWEDTCLAAMSSFIASGQNKDYGNDYEFAFRVTQMARAMVDTIRKYAV